MSIVITICNRKGGVGKTMTAISLGASLVSFGKKVHVIDADAQASATVSLGVTEPDKIKETLATVINDIISENEVNVTEVIKRHPEGMLVLPANNSLSNIKITLAPQIGREKVFKRYIDMIRSDFDFILIDCAPALNLMTINALAASDKVIIPVAPKFLDAKGLELLLKNIAQIRREINPKLTIGGILITMADSRTRIAKEVIEMINTVYGEKINIY